MNTVQWLTTYGHILDSNYANLIKQSVTRAEVLRLLIIAYQSDVLITSITR